MRVTYGELLAGMNQMARGLTTLGLGPGDTLAVVLANRREFIEAYGAAIQSGLFFVGVNWHLGGDEVAYILKDSGAKALVAESQFVAVAKVAAERAHIDHQVCFTVGPAEALRPISDLTAGQSDRPLARVTAGQVMFYTSGTTGRPKGVRKSFKAGGSDLLTLTSGIGPIRRLTRFDPADAPSDLVHLKFRPLLSRLAHRRNSKHARRGGLVVIMDKWTPQTFLRLVEEHRVTSATLVPTMFHRLLALPDEIRAASRTSPRCNQSTTLELRVPGGEATNDRVVGPYHHRVVFIDRRGRDKRHVQRMAAQAGNCWASLSGRRDQDS